MSLDLEALETSFDLVAAPRRRADGRLLRAALQGSAGRETAARSRTARQRAARGDREQAQSVTATALRAAAPFGEGYRLLRHAMATKPQSLSDLERRLTLTSPPIKGERARELQLLLRHNPFGTFEPGRDDGVYDEQTAAATRRAWYWMGCPEDEIGEHTDGRLVRPPHGRDGIAVLLEQEPRAEVEASGGDDALGRGARPSRASSWESARTGSIRSERRTRSGTACSVLTASCSRPSATRRPARARSSPAAVTPTRRTCSTTRAGDATSCHSPPSRCVATSRCSTETATACRTGSRSSTASRMRTQQEMFDAIEGDVGVGGELNRLRRGRAHQARGVKGDRVRACPRLRRVYSDRHRSGSDGAFLATAWGWSRPWSRSASGSCAGGARR